MVFHTDGLARPVLVAVIVVDFTMNARLDDLALREHRVVFCSSMPPPGATGNGSHATAADTAESVFDSEFSHVRNELEARRCELASYLEQPVTTIQQSCSSTATDGTAPLANYVRTASTDRLEQAILQLTALMVMA